MRTCKYWPARRNVEELRSILKQNALNPSSKSTKSTSNHHETFENCSEANLGWLGGSWTLSNLNLFAEAVEVGQDFRMELLGTSCDSLDAPFHDPCEPILQRPQKVNGLSKQRKVLRPYVRPESMESGLKSVPRGVFGRTSARKVTFCHRFRRSRAPNARVTHGFRLFVFFFGSFSAVLAASRIRFASKSRLLAGAMLICAQSLELSHSALVTKGRGCPAGRGVGAGELRTHFLDCGGGGASNLGLGAFGAVRLEGGRGVSGTWPMNFKPFGCLLGVLAIFICAFTLKRMLFLRKIIRLLFTNITIYITYLRPLWRHNSYVKWKFIGFSISHAFCYDKTPIVSAVRLRTPSNASNAFLRLSTFDLIYHLI